MNKRELYTQNLENMKKDLMQEMNYIQRCIKEGDYETARECFTEIGCVPCNYQEALDNGKVFYTKVRQDKELIKRITQRIKNGGMVAQYLAMTAEEKKAFTDKLQTEELQRMEVAE